MDQDYEKIAEMMKLTVEVLQDTQESLNGGDSVRHVLVFLDYPQKVLFNSFVVHFLLFSLLFDFVFSCLRFTVSRSHIRRVSVGK